jgi:hypothetical protein
MEPAMQHDEKPVRDLSRSEQVPASTGPVELDPALFAFVSGGAPRSGWPTDCTTDVTDPTAPRSGWA